MDPDRRRPRKSQTGVGLFNRTWPLARTILVSLSTALCAIVLGISIALSANPAIRSYVVVWTAPQAGAALLWTGIEVVTAYTGGKSRDIHPGAHLVVQLLLWLGFGAGVGLTACIVAFALSFDDFDPYPENYDYYGRDGYEYYSEYYIHSMEAVIAFLSLLIIVHFLLFVDACAETLRRKGARNTTVEDVTSERSEQPIQQLQSIQLSPIDEKKEIRSNAM